MNKMRGSGDWDVCSFPAIYLSMFIGYISLTQWRIIYTQRKFFYIISTAVLLNLFGCWAWISINSGEKSLDKIEDMILTDPGYYYAVEFPAEIEISMLYNKYAHRNKQKKFTELSYEKYGKTNINAVNNYIAMLFQNNDSAKVIPVLENAVADYPFYLKCYKTLFQIYDAKKQKDKTYNLAKYYVSKYYPNTDNVLDDPDAKKLLMQCVIYLYQNSLVKQDTVTYADATTKMKQLHIILPASK